MIKLVKITNANKNELNQVFSFDCGNDTINAYLKEDAFIDAQLGLTKTWLYFKNTKLIGYFTLTVDRITIIKSSNISKHLKQNKDYKERLNLNNVPSIQIHHFAIDKTYQNQKLGSEMMDYVFLYIKDNILCNIGACLINVFSIKKAVPFYKRLGFEKTGESRDTSNVSMAYLTKDLY